MRKALIGAGVLAALALLGLAGGYVYYFSGIRTAPKPLSASAPLVASTPAVAASTGASPSPGGLSGAWSVTSGSQAEYRVLEQFVGQTSSHEAVARTSGISGSLTVAGQPGSLRAAAITVSADLTGLHSVDQVAGFNVTNRDNIVSRTLSVSQFPKATFTAPSVAIPSGLESGQQVTVSVPGTLTIDGVTRDVDADLQLQLSGATAVVKGTIKTDMTAFGISPPQVPFTVVRPAVTIDFAVDFAPGA
jgi:polyisoprenoid-binding protein YceI